MEQNNDDGIVKRWVVLTADILGAKDLSNTDKIVLGFISSFEQYYASNETAGEFLGFTARTILASKQKLVRLGYVQVLKNTGRGMIYQFNTARLTKNCQSDCQNSVNQTDGKMSVENKDKIKRKQKGENEKNEGVEKSETYGRADINEIVALWKQEVGIDIDGQAMQRRAIYNLVRKYGCEGVKALVRRVGVATHSSDRFAPQIATPSDLVGKYGKLPKLEMWETRNKVARPFGNATITLLRKDKPDYNGAWNEQTDDERAKVTQMMREARSKLF